MTEMSGTRICRWCDQPIKGEAVRVPQFSSSAAKPDRYEHPADDPDCRRGTR
jgi:hypothetical protein